MSFDSQKKGIRVEKSVKGLCFEWGSLLRPCQKSMTGMVGVEGKISVGKAVS